MTAQQPRLGILGGMGPQATQVFYQRILDKTDARRDQEHLPTLIWSDTGMPDRTQAILSGQTEPVYQRLLADARLLEREGCTVLRDRGCDGAVLACTELSVYKDYHGVPELYLDAMDVLAEESIRACGYPLRQV